MTKLYKNKNYIYLMSGRAASILGSAIQEFCLSLYVLKVTGSSLMFSLVLALMAIPQVLISPFAGVLADRFDRKRILVILDFASGFITLLFAVIFFFYGSIPLIAVYILVFTLSSISAAFQPAISAVVPSIVDRDEYVNASSVSSTISTVCEMISPAIAGAFFGIFGVLFSFIINSASFFISAAFELFVKIPKFHGDKSKLDIKGFFTELTDGFKFVKTNAILFSIIILCFTINFSASTINVGFPYIVKNIFKVSDFAYGLGSSVMSLSALIVPIITVILAKRIKANNLITGGCLLFTICTLLSAFFVSPIFCGLFNSSLIPFISNVTVFFVLSGDAVLIGIIISSLFQQVCPMDKTGRVASLLNVGSYASIPVGQIVFGLLYSSLKAWITLVIGAVAFIISSIIIARSLSSIKAQEKMTA